MIMSLSRVPAVLPVLFLITAVSPASGQTRVATEGGAQFDIDLLRPSGGPVVPFFEGWQPNSDGSYELVFGYFNVNTEQVIDIPLGEANFIEPVQYDGSQPTHFQPVPQGDRRHWGVFTVRVPADFGDRTVVWTLRNGDRTFSVPGRITSSAYQLEGTVQPGRLKVAPRLQFEAGGPVVIGVAGATVGPLRTKVGSSLSLPVWATRENRFADESPILLRWVKHQGPGDVTFNPADLEVPVNASERPAEASTQVSFSEPGDYVLRLLAYNGVADFEFFCCWTNGYVRVTVTR